MVQGLKQGQVDAHDMGLESGRWLGSNCAKLPSELDCKLVMMGLEGQKEDLLDAAAAHAVKVHRHVDNAALRVELEALLDPMTV